MTIHGHGYVVDEGNDDDDDDVLVALCSTRILLK